MQIHQGNFVAQVQPIKNKGTLQTTHFRIRVVQLFPVERLITESIATDALTGYKRAEGDFEKFWRASGYWKRLLDIVGPRAI